jgi:ketosteroid isomerase-like protein
MSVTIRFPDSSSTTTLGGAPSRISRVSTASPLRKVTFRFRIWWISSSTISASRKLERAGSLVHQRHFHAQRGEHGRVLDADHSGAYDHQRARNPGELDDVVAGDDAGAVHRGIARRRGGVGAGGDEDIRRGDGANAVALLDAEGVGIQERAVAEDELDPVPAQLVFDDRAFLLYHPLDPLQQLGRGGPLVRAGRAALVERLAGPAERQDRFPEGLAGNGAGIHADAAQHDALFDDGDPAAQLGGLHRGPLARGAAAETDEIILKGRVHGGRSMALLTPSRKPSSCKPALVFAATLAPENPDAPVPSHPVRGDAGLDRLRVPEEGRYRAEETAIRAQNAAWNAAVVAKSDSAMAAIYADNGTLMPPNEKIVTGTAAIRSFFAMLWPMNANLVITSTAITVASSGDMATDAGTYTFSAGQVNDTGKYLVHWHKIGTTWKIVDDIWNSDTPLPAMPSMAMDSAAK